MIDEITIERFRGIKHLEVKGLGRVNVIIGKNNCGKTALMEAVEMMVLPTPGAVINMQRRRDATTPLNDLGQFWRPVFWNQDAETGLSVEATVGGRLRSVQMTSVLGQPSVTVDVDGSVHRPWRIAVTTNVDGQENRGWIVSTATGITSSIVSATLYGWTGTSHDFGPTDVSAFSRLKQDGRDEDVVTLLKIIDPRAAGVELLAPSGQEAKIFVRVSDLQRLLPVRSMGDGFQRCLEIATCVAGPRCEVMFIDEIENGLHHTVLESIWSWIARVSGTRGLQFFVTTHSEECISAAVRAFTALDDDGLRIIRLDRYEDRTTAAVYDRKLVETAIETGIEIRG